MMNSSVMETVTRISSLLKTNSFQELDRLIITTNVSAETIENLVSLLRLTYPLRDRFKSRSTLLDSVRAELKSRNLNSDIILRGL